MADAALDGIRALTPPAVPPEALREWLPAAGSDLYYALRYVPVPLGTRLALLESFRRHLANLPLTCSNHDIAHAKLAWWQRELHALGTPECQHALSRALSPLVTHDAVATSALFALVEGLGRLLDSPRFETTEARRAAYAQAHGPLWNVHAEWCGLRAPADSAALARLGIAVELAYGLRDMRRTIEAGMTWLTRTHEPDSRAETSDADWYAAVAQREVPYLRGELQQARQSLPRRGAAARGCRAALVLADLADGTLAEIAADGFRVWERRVELTPLRKLWRTLRIRSST